MRAPALLALTGLALLAACSRGGGDNEAANDANAAAAEGVDLDVAIGGDELSPIPEAEDDMIANNSGLGNAVGNTAAPQPPTQPSAPLRPPPPPQGR